MVKANKEISVYERSLNEAERILATHKDVVVPVKEIWLEVSKQGQLQRFEVLPLLDFTVLLEGDDRFEFIPAGEELGDTYVEPTDEDEPGYSTDMERLGFYSEDRVRLRNIEVSEELAEEIAEEKEEPATESPLDVDETVLHAGATQQKSKQPAEKNNRKAVKNAKRIVGKIKKVKTVKESSRHKKKGKLK